MKTTQVTWLLVHLMRQFHSPKEEKDVYDTNLLATPLLSQYKSNYTQESIKS